jgi:hypothetical protein
MVPEGQNEESSLVAVIPFYRRFEDPSPKFQLINDSRGWFSIREIKHTVVSFWQFLFLWNLNLNFIGGKLLNGLGANHPK